MRYTCVYDEGVDSAIIHGRGPYVEATPNLSHIWVPMTTDGDIVKGDDSKAVLKISTDGGASFGAIITALDLWPQGDALEGACPIYDPRNGRLHLICLSTIGLPPAAQWYGSAVTPPMVHIYSDGMGAAGSWSAPTQITTPYANHFTVGRGTYDPVSGLLIIPCAGRSAPGVLHSPFALVSATGAPGTWQARSLIDPGSDQGEWRVICEPDGEWWAITRREPSQVRRVYRDGGSNGNSWTRVTAAVEVPSIPCNLGLDATDIGGVRTWLMSTPLFYARAWGPGIDINSPRRSGRILASRHRGRGWQAVSRLTNDRGSIAQTFFGYSDLRATNDHVLCVWEGARTGPYQTVQLAVVAKSELTALVQLSASGPV